MDFYTAVGPGFQNFFRIRKTGFEWVHKHNTVLLIYMTYEKGGLNVFFKIKHLIVYFLQSYFRLH